MVKDFGAKKLKTSLQEDVGRYYFTVFEFISANKNIYKKKSFLKVARQYLGMQKKEKYLDMGDAGRN